MSTAIEFNHVGKQYRLGIVSTKTLSHDLNRWWQISVLGKEDPYLKIGETNDRSAAGSSEYVWALQNIDFKVEQGDVVGVIGKNGAGKSTLLKLLSKVTGPTTGTICARGRIGALLEVGTGFHPEMTGRENIFMNGAIMGMTKNDISRRLDEIIAFSGCERYIDTPVKRYSSGMTVRLGFAIAAHLEPEILVVDEVLAVGDAEFQKKAIGKMQDVSRGEGRTVLFVSHNMASIRKLCRKGVILDKGLISYQGVIEDCISNYLASNLDDLYGHTIVSGKHHDALVLKELEYLDIRMENDFRNVSSEEPLSFMMVFRRNQSNVTSCQFGIVIRDESDSLVGAMYSCEIELPQGKDLFEVSIRIPEHHLAKGRYSLNFNISRNDFSSSIRNFDIVWDVIRFEITYRDALHQQPFTMWNLGRIAYPPVVPTINVL